MDMAVFVLQSTGIFSKVSKEYVAATDGQMIWLGADSSDKNRIPADLRLGNVVFKLQLLRVAILM